MSTKFKLLFSLVITIHSIGYPMKKIKNTIKKGLDKFSYQVHTKYKKEREITSFYKKMHALFDDTYTLINNLSRANYIPKDGKIKDFAQDTIKFTELLYKKYPSSILQEISCQEQENILNASNKIISKAQKHFMAYKEKTKWMEPTNEMRIENVNAYINKVKCKICKLQSINNQLKSYCDQPNIVSYSSTNKTFTIRKAGLEANFIKSINQRTKELIGLIYARKYRLILHKIRYELYTIILQLHRDNIIDDEDCKILKQAINAYLIDQKEGYPYTCYTHIYQINNIIKKSDTWFLKNIVLSIGLFYNIEELNYNWSIIKKFKYTLETTHTIKSDYEKTIKEIIQYTDALIVLEKYLK